MLFLTLFLSCLFSEQVEMALQYQKGTVTITSVHMVIEMFRRDAPEQPILDEPMKMESKVRIEILDVNGDETKIRVTYLESETSDPKVPNPLINKDYLNQPVDIVYNSKTNQLDYQTEVDTAFRSYLQGTFKQFFSTQRDAFPNHPVKIGDTWQSENSDFLNMGALPIDWTNKNTYRFAEWVPFEAENRKWCKVTFEGTITGDSETDFAVFQMDGNVEGNYVFDPMVGHLVTQEMRQVVDLDIESPNGVQQLKQIMTMLVEVEVVSRGFSN